MWYISYVFPLHSVRNFSSQECLTHDEAKRKYFKTVYDLLSKHGRFHCTYIYSKVNGCWFYRYFFSNTNLYLRLILLAIHKLYYNTLFTRTHFLTTHSISYTTSMSCVHWNPIIITLFTMFTLIEYCISDISNINFIILNMLKKFQFYYQELMNNFADTLVFVYFLNREIISWTISWFCIVFKYFNHRAKFWY